MKALAAMSFLSLSLAGCGATPMMRSERVEVPVAVPCRVQRMAAPAWATSELPEDASFYQKVTALLAELEQRKAYERRIEAALAACG
ncbi:Uncharacterised protein [Bordetella ansorpii]|uniref:Lipoprotein n=2 Tax=Bordetella ansorpii TaxID=288768 RepID=A0A157SJR6_9BORD|nr:Uncharacterised protein [Bordetella ansorpii]